MQVVKDSPFRKTGLKRIVNATRFSWQGLSWLAKNEPAFRQELVICALLSVVSFFLNVSPMEWLVLNAALIFILLVEVINTAVEAVVDRIGPEVHPLSGLAKDLGSAAVFLSLCLAALCWGVVLWS